MSDDISEYNEGNFTVWVGELSTYYPLGYKLQDCIAVQAATTTTPTFSTDSLKRMMQQQMETTTPSTDCLRTLANYYRELSGQEYAKGMDAKAAEYRNAAGALDKLRDELPRIPVVPAPVIHRGSL